jgi:hypothetical protein
VLPVLNALLVVLAKISGMISWISAVASILRSLFEKGISHIWLSPIIVILVGPLLTLVVRVVTATCC